MQAADAVMVSGVFEAADVRAWVEGGWGVDALMGRQTRDHDDVDLAVDERTIVDFNRLPCAPPQGARHLR